MDKGRGCCSSSTEARLYAPPCAPVLRPGQILSEVFLRLPGRITDGARSLGGIQHVAEVASGFPGPLLPPRGTVLVAVMTVGQHAPQIGAEPHMRRIERVRGD